MYIIVEKRLLNETAMLMSIHAPLIAEAALPGQFAAVQLMEHSPPVPLVIAGYDRRAGEVTAVFHPGGPAAKSLAVLEVGDALPGLLGPFGRPSELPAAKRVIAVCGGLGCAVLYPQIKCLHAAGAQVDVIAGFRSRGSMLLEEQLRAHCTDLAVCTADGSCGRQSPASLLLHERLQRESYQLAIAAGPTAMLQAVCTLTQKAGLPTTVSLHPAVTNREGRCSVCRIPMVGQESKCACTGGPDFNGHEIDWSALAQNAACAKEDTAFCCPLLPKKESFFGKECRHF